jgi:hypothetical protein
MACILWVWGLVWSVNWADWISALSNLALAGLAAYGLTIWRRPALAQRDHDVAMRLLAAISKAYVVLDEVRTGVPLITDAPGPSSVDGESTDVYEYRVVRARYRGRLRRLAEVAEARTVAMMEMLETIGDKQAGEMVTELVELEARVRNEAATHVNRLSPHAQREAPPPDMTVLFAPFDAEVADPFADEYEGVIESIRERLGPAIRMEEHRVSRPR